MKWSYTCRSSYILMVLICVSRSSSVCPSGLFLPSFLSLSRAMLTRSIFVVSQLLNYLCSRRRSINTHRQAPRLGPRASALEYGELAENVQAPRRSLHKRGKVPAVVGGAAVTAGETVITAPAATTTIDATEIDPPGGERWRRGVSFRSPPPAPAPGSAAGASHVAGGAGDHTSVMSGSDSLSEAFTLPPP